MCVYISRLTAKRRRLLFFFSFQPGLCAHSAQQYMIYILAENMRLFFSECSGLASLSGHFIIWYEILALLKLEDHFGPSSQCVNDIKVRTHDLPGMLHSLFESSHIQHHWIVLH